MVAFRTISPTNAPMNVLMKRIASLICCLLSFSALAETSELESRSATKQETDAFNRFYLKNHPGKIGTPVNFLITRISPKKAWDIRARVLNDPVHGYQNLCKQDLDNFEFDARGWHESARPTTRMVWLDQGKACKVGQYVELETSLPDVEVIDMLGHADAILKHSYILLRGNTNCSLIYLQSLKLVGIGTATLEHEEMLSFRYLGDQHIPVALSVRRLASEYTTWDMHCPIP